MNKLFYKIVLFFLFFTYVVNATESTSTIEAHSKWILIDEPDFYLARCEIVVNGNSFIYGMGENDTYCNKIIPIDDGYLAIGYIQPLDGDPFLINLDEYGHENCRFTMRTKKLDEELYLGLQSKDKGFITAGRVEFLYAGGSKSIMDHPYILKVSSDCKKVWDVTFNKKGSQYPMALYESKKGDIYIAGDDALAKKNKDLIWVAKVDKYGKKRFFKVIKTVSTKEKYQLSFREIDNKVYLLYNSNDNSFCTIVSKDKTTNKDAK